MALRVNHADAPQQIEGIALRGEMTPQAPAGGITHVQFLQERGIVHSSVLEITEGFRVMGPLAVIRSTAVSLGTAPAFAAALCCSR